MKIKIKTNPKLQKYAFSSGNPDVVVVLTLESILDSGIPIDDFGDDMEYVGVVASDTPIGTYDDSKDLIEFV